MNMSILSFICLTIAMAILGLSAIAAFMMLIFWTVPEGAPWALARSVMLGSVFLAMYQLIREKRES